MLMSTAEVIETIKEAIPGVCGPKKSTIQRSQNFVLDNGEDIPVILVGLNKICGGIFMSKAGLDVDIPQGQVEIVDAALIGVGRTPPSDLALKKKVGATDLTTTAEDLSRAVNELDGEIGDLSDLLTTDKSELVCTINEIKLGGGHDADVYVPIGTLGSSYSCTSTSDTSPTLIATGQELDSAMNREKQKCAIWSVFTHDGRCRGENIYLSYSPDGSCFEATSCDDGAGPAYVYCIYGLDH